VPPPMPSNQSDTQPDSPKVEIVGRSLKERRQALAAAQMRQARERVEAALAVPIPLPPPPIPVIHDYKGWYELFGVQPDADYLRPSRHKDVTQRLKENRIILALQHHRDQGGSDQKMTQLNVAWDQLKKGKQAYERQMTLTTCSRGPD